MRESDLCERVTNRINHCGTHKCSSYCLRPHKKMTPYNPEVHGTDVHANIVSLQNSEYIQETYYECRMGFGIAKQYDVSGEKNLTGGMIQNPSSNIYYDKNGMPKLNAARNHPHILQQPSLFHFFGANNDTQFLPVSYTHLTLPTICSV